MRALFYREWTMSETEARPRAVDAPEVVEESATPEPAEASEPVSTDTEADAGCETVDADEVEVVTVDPAAARSRAAATR